MKKILNNINITLLIILLIGTVLRFLCLDKTDGLWYDELVSYKQASQPDILSIIFYTLKTDIHFPLYQILLHLWSNVFTFSDYSLRSFSAICGIAAIFVSFLVGKELNSPKTGLICAGVFSVNSFLIYYSQEVRMYSLMVLLLCCYLLFLLRIKNNYKNKWNYIGLIFFAFTLICSYTIAIVFVLSQFFILVFYLINKYEMDRSLILKNSAIFTILLGILCTPFFGLLYIFQLKTLSGTSGFTFNISYLLILLQDWFTPIINTSFPMYYSKMLFLKLNSAKFIFIFIPILLAIYSLIYSIKKDKFSIVIFSGIIFFLMAEIIIVSLTPFQINPRHTFVIVPSLLVLVSYGFSLMYNKKSLNTVLISLFLGINLFYLIFAQNSAFKMSRSGYKPLAKMIQNSDIKQDDCVVIWNRREVLDKYINTRLNVFSLLKNFAYTSEVILNNEAELNKYSIEERKILLRSYFSNNSIPVNTNYIMKAIYTHMKPGQKFIITTTENLNEYTLSSFHNIIEYNKAYSEISYNDLLTVKALLDLKTLSYKYFHFVRKQQDKGFVVLVFEKL